MTPPKKPDKRALKQAVAAAKADTLTSTKERIQTLLRQIVILRDGGCWLRHYPEHAGRCGTTVLQAEHLVNRARSVGYGDTRLVVCICRSHHVFFKRRNPGTYELLVRRFIGPDRTRLLDRIVLDAGTNYYFSHSDWTNIEIALTQELREYQQKVVRKNEK